MATVSWVLAAAGFFLWLPKVAAGAVSFYLVAAELLAVALGLPVGPSGHRPAFAVASPGSVGPGF
jgi:hypothetical protein